MASLSPSLALSSSSRSSPARGRGSSGTKKPHWPGGANDTSLGVGYAPLSETEELIPNLVWPQPWSTDSSIRERSTMRPKSQRAGAKMPRSQSWRRVKEAYVTLVSKMGYAHQSGSFGYLFFGHLQPLLGVIAGGFFQEISKAFVGIHGLLVAGAYYRLCGHS